MLTEKDKNAILEYYAEVCRFLINCRKESHRVPADHWIIYATKRAEGSLRAIRSLTDLLGLPKNFLPNRDRIIV